MSKKYRASSSEVRIVYGADGTKDIYRPGSLMFGTLADIPEHIAKELAGRLPMRPIPETGWPPSVFSAMWPEWKKGLP